jgi:hypothetical protein
MQRKSVSAGSAAPGFFIGLLSSRNALRRADYMVTLYLLFPAKVLADIERYRPSETFCSLSKCRTIADRAYDHLQGQVLFFDN